MAPWLLRAPRVCAALLAASFAIRVAVFFIVAPRTPTYFIWSYFFFPATLMFFLMGHFANALFSRVSIGLPASLLLLSASAAGFYFSAPMTVDYVADYIFCACFALSLPGI